MNKIFLLCMLALVAAGTSPAQTNVSGALYSNTTWTAANSPYIVTANVIVFDGVQLTIEPGVTVKRSEERRVGKEC